MLFSITACGPTDNDEHTSHPDTNPHDGICDVGGETLKDAHPDTNPHDGKCDIGGETIDPAHPDSNNDGKCDVGGETLKPEDAVFTVKFGWQDVKANNEFFGGITQSAYAETAAFEQENTLTLDANGNYQLKKVMRSTRRPNVLITEDVNVEYNFAGTYVRYKDFVSLNPAVSGTASVSMGTFGKFVPDADKAEGEFNSDDKPEIMNFFPTGFFLENTGRNTRVQVLVNEDGSFAYDSLTNGWTANDSADGCEHLYRVLSGKCVKCNTAHVHSFTEITCNGCYYVCTHETHNSQTMLCNVCGVEIFHDYRSDNGGKCTMCSETSSYEHYAVPEKYRATRAEAGTVVNIEYDTIAYAYDEANNNPEGTTTVTKDLNVYLPYGYTTEKKYNVIYLLHGSTGSQNMWFGLKDYSNLGYYTTQMLDNLHYYGEMEDTIIVAMTFYYTQSSKVGVTAGYGEDAQTMGLGYPNMLFVQNFHKELRGTIVPLIETRYSTYSNQCGKSLEEYSEEAVIASRSHRAMAGLSMGSMTTWNAGLLRCTDYFANFGCFSAAPSPDPDKTANDQAASIIATLNEKFADYSIDFFYSGTGTAESHIYQGQLTNALVAQNSRWFTSANTAYVNKLNKAHDYWNWIIDLYNVCKFCFFKTAD